MELLVWVHHAGRVNESRDVRRRVKWTLECENAKYFEILATIIPRPSRSRLRRATERDNSEFTVWDTVLEGDGPTKTCPRDPSPSTPQ